MHSGHRKRLKDKIMNLGFESLYPHEMLEFILFASIPRRNTNDLAHNLIEKIGSYEEVFQASKEELMQIENIGEASVLQIKSYQNHAKRIMGEDEPTCLKSIGDARVFFADYFSKKKKEEFHVVLLDNEGKAIVHEIYTDKQEDKVVVPINDIMQECFACKPSFALFAHNHPSGNANPSQRDIDFTESLWHNLEMYAGITTHEHMIFSGNACYSFRHNCLLNERSSNGD